VLALLTALLTFLAVLAALLSVLIRIVCPLYSFTVAERELTRRCGIMFGILYSLPNRPRKVAINLCIKTTSISLSERFHFQHLALLDYRCLCQKSRCVGH
jgi:hypothetical protein